MKHIGPKSCPHIHEYSKHKQNTYENWDTWYSSISRGLLGKRWKKEETTQKFQIPLYIQLEQYKKKVSYLKFICPVPAEGLQRKTQVIRFCQVTQIKIILGINTGGNINIKLQQLKKLAFQLIPVERR